MIRLAIDASTPVCTVGLVNETKQTSFFRWEKRQGVHSERLFGQIQEVLSDAQLDLTQVDEFVITSGPGSYTGLRIAASALKGLLFGQQTELIAVQSLAYIAASILEFKPDLTCIHAVIDARRTHLFHQVFEIQNGEIQQVSTLEIREIAEIKSQVNKNDALGGTGVERLQLSENEKAELYLFDERVSLNPVVLASFSAKNASWKSFCTKVNPALFEPNYYTSGHAQVHQSVTS